MPYTLTSIQLRILDIIVRTYNRQIYSLIEAANGVGKTTSLAVGAAMLAKKGVKTAIFCLTYRQISRVVSELRRVDPSLKAVVLGSQNALCCADNVASPRAVCRVRELREVCPYGRPSADYSGWLFDVNEIVFKAREKGVCAYETAWMSAKEAQIIVAPQAYLLYENSWNKISKFLGESFILVDECHNLIHSGVNIFNIPLAFESETCKEIVGVLLKSKRWSKRKLLEKLGSKEEFIEKMKGEIRAALERGDYPLSWRIVNELDVAKLLWEADYDRVFVEQNQASAYLGFPEEYLNRRLNVFCGGVFVSATPGSIDAYRRMVHDRPLYVEALEAPYTKDEFKIYIVNDFTTRFPERTDENYLKVCDRIMRLLGRTRSLGVYFPSYEYLNKVVLLLTESQTQVSLKAESSSLIEVLYDGRRAVLSVQGGSEGEGAEVPGGLDLVLVVGLALPFPKSLLVVREKMYRGLGISDPEQPAYISWATQKAVQAIGRVIRGPGDRGIGVLMDRRFEYERIKKSMPSWFKSYIIGSVDFEKLMSSL